MQGFRQVGVRLAARSPAFEQLGVALLAHAIGTVGDFRLQLRRQKLVGGRHALDRLVRLLGRKEGPHVLGQLDGKLVGPRAFQIVPGGHDDRTELVQPQPAIAEARRPDHLERLDVGVERLFPALGLAQEFRAADVGGQALLAVGETADHVGVFSQCVLVVFLNFVADAEQEQGLPRIQAVEARRLARQGLQLALRVLKAFLRNVDLGPDQRRGGLRGRFGRNLLQRTLRLLAVVQAPH